MKLKALIDKEQSELATELKDKQRMQGCGYCKEKEMKIAKYEEEIEMEKKRNCIKALEREKM